MRTDAYKGEEGREDKGGGGGGGEGRSEKSVIKYIRTK